MDRNKNIVVFGTGAIGGVIGAWVAEKYENIYFYDLPNVLDTLEEKGITHYLQNHEDQGETVKVKTLRDFADMPEPDVIIIAVKNYSLDKVCEFIKGQVKNNPLIVGLQNGHANQQILPKHFDRVIYGVVEFNAWLDEPCVVGYQNRGPVIIGTKDNAHKEDLAFINEVFNLGCETFITDRLHDAVHTKMIINLTNSLTTLIGHKVKEIPNRDLFQKLLSNLTYEGVQIVKAAGYQEYKMTHIPSWTLLKAAVTLPRFVTRPIFNKNLKKMVISSMAQDVILNGSSDSELETINGYLMSLADENKVSVPYNKAVYNLCREHFSKEKFEPISVEEVWSAVEAAM